MTVAGVESEATFAALVERLGAEPDHRERLTELLREEHPLYDQRGTATTVRMRGWLLLALARSGVPDDALLFVLEELESGVDPYLVAAAARALRSYARPEAAFAPLLLRAVANIRFRDERVALDRYGAYAVGPVGTTPVRELLATLSWLGPHAQAVLAELEVLRQDRGLARKYGDDMDAALAAIRGGESSASVADSCCELPGAIRGSRWWPFASRAGIGDVEGVVFEDHEGTARTFQELFRGRVSIVVFFYTRCDNPLKCSLTVSKLARVQQLLEERGLSGRITTAAITYDPAFDVPERLRAYGKDRRVRMDGDHRLLRTVDRLNTLRRYFGLGVNFIGSLVNRHQIEAYVLDAEGRIAASFERLQWDETELVNRSVAVMEEKRDAEPEPSATTAAAAERRMAFPMLATLASIAVAFFPKCPVCWAAYLSLFGIAGLNQIPYAPWLQPLLAALALVNVGTVWLRGRATRRMTGFYLVTAGALVTLSSVPLGWRSVAVLGILLTVAGSLVSARRTVASKSSRLREELLPGIADAKIPG
jgi:protein SCO1/2